MKKIYEKAIELFNKEFCTGTQNRELYEGFEFVKIELNKGGDRGTQGGNDSVKIMKKEIGFTFTIHKEDPEDLNRMQFVYDITIAAKNNALLLPFAKKVIPDWQKIDKKFPGKITQKEYNSLDIHNKEEIITFIEKVLN